MIRLDKACPLCNGMEEIKGTCPRCSTQWEDGGTVDDYIGPYSPYEAQLVASTGTKEECVHLLYCPVCGYDKRVRVSRVKI